MGPTRRCWSLLPNSLEVPSNSELDFKVYWMTSSGKPPYEILKICLETMEGHQRSIMGNMTVEEIYRDRQTFSQKVFDVASVDLHNMGISVISYTLKDIRDDVGYLASLGQARTAQVGKRHSEFPLSSIINISG